MRSSVIFAVVTMTVLAVPAVGPAAADGFVSVSTTVTPDQPAVEETFTVTATVSNADDSATAYRVTDAVLREGQSSSSETVAESDPSVRVAAGATRNVTVDATLNETGTRTLYLHLTVLDDSGNRRTVIQPVTVDVQAPHPQLGVSAESGAPGESRPLAVTVSNGFDTSITNVELSVAGERVSVTNDRRVTASVAAGADRVFEFAATPETESRLPVTVTLSYTVDGDRRTVEQTLTADFATSGSTGARPQVELSVEKAVPGADRSVNVTVANGLSNELRQVQVSVGGDQVSFGERERVTATLAAGETRTFRFPASVTEAGRYPVNVTVVYTNGGVQERVTRTLTGDFTAPDAPGTVELTSVSAVAQNGRLQIDATASNPGTSDVGGVLVSIGDNEAVGSADFFVGEVGASDFNTFRLATGVAGNVSEVPLQVSYVVDGVRQSYTTTVDVTVIQSSEDTENGGGLPLLPIVGGVIVLVLVVLGVAVWRR